MASRICIVSTVHEPPPIIDSFIRYHLSIGVSHLFLFFDDPADPAIQAAARYSEVTAIASDEMLRAGQRQNRVYERVARFAHEIQARQILNAETAIPMALERGMDWILHMDADELLYSPLPVTECFDGLLNEVGQVSLRNFEGVPESTEIIDYFSEVTLFKKHGHLLSADSMKSYRRYRPRRYYFLGYGNGKSAGRVAPGLLPLGVHRFAPARLYPQTMEYPSVPVILHYINCGFSSYLRKHERLPSDTWLGVPIPHEFYLESRRLAGNQQALRELYQREVLFDDAVENDYLVGRGVLSRIVSPARALRGADHGD